jgi:signal transduction histidine kinase
VGQTDPCLRPPASSDDAVLAHLLRTDRLARLGSLTAGIAHELNNPVSFVSGNLGALSEYWGWVHSLLREYRSLQQTLSAATAAPAVAEHLARLAALHDRDDLEFVLEDTDKLLADCTEGLKRITDLLGSVRALACRDGAEAHPADVNRCVEDALRVAANELKHRARVVRRLSATTPVAVCGGELVHALVAIISNAVEALAHRGTITVETESVAGGVCIRIADDGEGMAAETLAQAFDPFFTTRQTHGHAGLGLTMAREVAERLGGTIGLSSTPGHGTLVALQLPGTVMPDTTR